MFNFFESLYGARAGRCRKLHNIVNSVVILDEAQLVPPNLLQPCTAAIKDLTHNYGVTLLLSTLLSLHYLALNHVKSFQRIWISICA